jgi:hypothetical protein
MFPQGPSVRPAGPRGQPLDGRNVPTPLFRRRRLNAVTQHSFVAIHLDRLVCPHAFDLFQDTESSREIVRQILAFLRFHLVAS